MSPPSTHSARSRAALASGIASLLVALYACGGERTTAGLAFTNPIPALTAVSPSTIVVGSAATTLTLSGGGFTSSSQVRWNDADRVTHYQSVEALTVDLLASDLASVNVGKLTVVNGTPGGGTSAALDVTVGYPAPQITAVSPASVPIQSGSQSQSITITGTGFVPQSTVRAGANQYAVTSRTSTQLVISIPNSDLATSGPMPLTVTNPAPGGGTSNAMDFGVDYPVPTLLLTSPDSSFVGPSFWLLVTGSGFGPDSRVQWNGQDRQTTFLTTTQMTANILATDIANPTVAMLTVRNPTPGGGASNALSYKVVVPAPVITAVSPGFVSAGAGSTTITITGTNFQTGATAQWNGANRSAALVSGTSMTMTLTPADVATPQTGKVTVTNSGASGTSNALAVGVVSASPSLTVDRTVTLTHADLVYDQQRNVFYASVPSTASQYADEIVRIDPASGAVTGEVSVGSNPNALAITDDGQFLYAGLLGAPRIVRIALATLTRDADIQIQIDTTIYGNGTNRYAEDIQPIPGAPKLIAASTFYQGVGMSRNAGTLLFNDTTQLPKSGPALTGSNRITRGPDASYIYGYNNQNTEFGIRSLSVAADGLRQGLVKRNILSGFDVDIEYGGGFIYSTNGDVASLPTMTKVGTIAVSGAVRPDAANARVHFLSGNTIYTYHYTQFTALGSYSDASLANHTTLVRWGTDGLAAGGGATIVLLRGALVAP